jgi:hypothetical protein
VIAVLSFVSLRLSSTFVYRFSSPLPDFKVSICFHGDTTQEE